MKRIAVALGLLAAGPAALAQGHPDEAALLAAQRAAMAPLAIMDGLWRGEATMVAPSGERTRITQTERIGSFLGGTIKVIEGRGYPDDVPGALIRYQATIRDGRLHEVGERLGQTRMAPKA